VGFVACESRESEQDSGRREHTAALKFWLGNRQPDRWREQPEEVPEEYLIEEEGQEG
jgi:hypothetical protein